MKKALILGVFGLLLVPTLAQAQFGQPQFQPPEQQLEQALEQRRNAIAAANCAIFGETSLSGSMNTLDVIVRYESDVTISNVAYTLEVHGTQGVLEREEGRLNMPAESRIVVFEDGTWEREYRFDPRENESVALRISLEGQACATDEVDAVQPPVIHIPEVEIPDLRFNPEAGAQAEGEAGAEAEANGDAGAEEEAVASEDGAVEPSDEEALAGGTDSPDVIPTLDEEEERMDASEEETEEAMRDDDMDDEDEEKMADSMEAEEYTLVHLVLTGLGALVLGLLIAWLVKRK